MNPTLRTLIIEVRCTQCGLRMKLPFVLGIPKKVLCDLCFKGER